MLIRSEADADALLLTCVYFTHTVSIKDSRTASRFLIALFFRVCLMQEQHWRKTRLQRFCTLLAELEE